MTRSLLAFLLILLIAGSADAQVRPVQTSVDSSAAVKDQYLEMNGIIRGSRLDEKENSKPVDSAEVTIFNGNRLVHKLYTNRKGKLSFRLELNKVYSIQVSRDGYVTKHFEVNTRAPQEKKNHYVFNFELAIFNSVEGLDVSVLQKPIARVTYNYTEKQFAYDVAYTNRVNLELKKMYRNYYLLEQMARDTMMHDTIREVPKKSPKQ